MAKQTQSHKQLTRKQVARREREHRAQQIMTISAIAVGIVIVGILAFGIVSEVFIKARKPVALVGNVTITAQQFKDRQSYERWMTQLQIYQYQNLLTQFSAQQPSASGTITGTEPISPTDSSTTSLVQQLQVQISSLENQLSPDLSSVYGGQVLDSMIEEELVRQEADARGITATDDEVQKKIEQLLGYTADTAASSAVTDTTTLTDTTTITTPTPEVAPTPTPVVQSFDEVYAQFKTNVLDATRFSDSEFRTMVKAQVLRDNLQAQLADGINRVQDQVESTLFVVPTEEEATTIQTRLNDEGVDPATIVDELTADTNDATAGYTLPWLPVGYLSSQVSTDVERAAFNTPVGRASDPILGATDGQYYVIFVQGHEEHPLSSDLLASAEQQAYDEWLTQARTDHAQYLDWEGAVLS